MKECFCSIFNTREECIVDEDGRVYHRLICNICGRVLDSKEAADDNVATKDSENARESESEDEAIAY